MTVRINVAPTDINLDDGGTAVNLPTDRKMAHVLLSTAEGETAGIGADGAAVTIAENVKDQAAVKLADLDVMDQNFDGDANNPADPFGSFDKDTLKLSDSRFEIREGTDDNDASTWELWLKEDATFNYEVGPAASRGTLVVTVTATDGGNLKTVGYFKITITDEAEEDPPTPPKTEEDPPEVPGLEDDADDSDNDGPVIPPEDGGAFLDDDLLDNFVLAIDDIDIA